jgi:hypothetical protein
MADASPGFFSSLMGGLGGLLGYKDAPPDPPPDPNAQQKDESAADYATRRQQARFGKMKEEVDGLLQRYPATGDFPAISEERRGLRQRGFDQKEENAIVNTFIHVHGERAGHLLTAEKSGREEWQGQPPTAPGAMMDELYNSANPPLPPGVKMPAGPLLPRDDQVQQRLLDYWNQSGRTGYGREIGKDKRGRPRITTDPDVGIKT